VKNAHGHTGARARKQKYISIHISLYMKTFLKTGVYIYINPFSTRFSYREIYRYIYAFVFLHVRPCAFFTYYCDKFFRVLCSNLKRTCRWVFFFFLEKCMGPAVQIFNGELYGWLCAVTQKTFFFNILCRSVETEVPDWPLMSWHL